MSRDDAEASQLHVTTQETRASNPHQKTAFLLSAARILTLSNKYFWSLSYPECGVLPHSSFLSMLIVIYTRHIIRLQYAISVVHSNLRLHIIPPPSTYTIPDL